MPEGPSIMILKEQASIFKGKKVTAVGGNAKIDKSKALNKKITDIKSWGKHLLICFNGFTIRIHLMLFGSYRINEEKDAIPRLSFTFKQGTLNFYACSVVLLDGDLSQYYDWSEDIMSDEWDAKSAINKLKAENNMLACDALLDQHIFSGSGNIIKNEVLFRTRIHPLSLVNKLPLKQLRLLVNETRNYAFDFLKWKKEMVLKQHWLAHTKTECPRCNIPLIKEYLGKTHRRTYFCNSCQKVYE